MAHTKSGGSTQNVRDSQPQYLGVKLHDGEHARPGNIILRQRGAKVLAGVGVRIGHDDTLYAAKEGIVKFGHRRKIRYDGLRVIRKTVSIM